MQKIGIVTINYYSEDLIERFIRGLLNQTYNNWILVVVNNSPDDIYLNKVIKSFESEKILLLNINKNVGYSEANNYGFCYLTDKKIISDDDMVLFSNEDIVIKDENYFRESVRMLNKLECGFLGPKIINNDGSLMLPHLKKTGFLKCMFHIGNNGVVDRIFGINRSLKKIKGPKRVFLLNGACFLCRASDFIRAGMFNTNTFIYYSEELIYRKIDDCRIGVIYYPGIEVYHDHSGSVKKSFSILRKKRFVYESELYFLTEILKVNKFLLFLFKTERNMEFLLNRFLSALRLVR
ncbi:MAG: glycosyltransferase [Actinobacteria bacterium]|nr:glycosyltransferase [Actinomycetota bacterium]